MYFVSILIDPYGWKMIYKYQHWTHLFTIYIMKDTESTTNIIMKFLNASCFLKRRYVPMYMYSSLNTIIKIYTNLNQTLCPRVWLQLVLRVGRISTKYEILQNPQRDGGHLRGIRYEHLKQYQPLYQGVISILYSNNRSFFEGTRGWSFNFSIQIKWGSIWMTPTLFHCSEP